MTQLMDQMLVRIEEMDNDFKTSITSTKTKVRAILDAIEDEKEGNIEYHESMSELVNLSQTEAMEEYVEDSGMKTVDNIFSKSEQCNEHKLDENRCEMVIGDVR